jgi:hypothetical protein
MALQRCLQPIGTFSPAELELIVTKCSHRHIAKNDYVLQAGEVCNAISFLLSGACYEFHIEDTDERIIELYCAYDCIVSPSSFFFQRPAEDPIKAFTDCEVLTLSIHDLHQLIGVAPVFFQLGKILQPGWFRVGFYDQAMSPREKYSHLMAHKPEIIRTFPLKYIASYLKITPETLSRIRAAQ